MSGFTGGVAMGELVGMLLQSDLKTMLGCVVGLILGSCASGLVICHLVWSVFQAYDLLASIIERR